MVNKLRGTLDVLAPGFGDRRKATLQDIAVLTGGTVISEENADAEGAVVLNQVKRTGILNAGESLRQESSSFPLIRERGREGLSDPSRPLTSFDSARWNQFSVFRRD